MGARARLTVQRVCFWLNLRKNNSRILSETSQVYFLDTEGLFTQGLQPGWTVGGSVGGILEMDCSDWSNGIQYQIFDTRPDTEFENIT